MSLRLPPRIRPSHSSEPPLLPYLSAVSIRLMPRSSALCTTRPVAAKSKLLPPRPTTHTSSAELPTLRFPIAPNSELSCHRNDRVRASRLDDGVEHRHAVHHFFERDRVGFVFADRARERGELRVE